MSDYEILMRPSLAEEEEMSVAKKYFEVKTQRALASKNSTIICRYSALPYFKELEEDLKILWSKPINSYFEHSYVADMKNWYDDLKGETPETWFRLEDVPRNLNCSFVLKGSTNSRKSLWKTHMFAEKREDVMKVACRLMDDSLISSQNIYVRKFEPMISYGDGIQGIPITNEWRHFVCDGEVVASGFYWSEHKEWLAENKINPAPPPEDFARKIINKIKNKIRFVVIDFGQKINGDWMVVELNDGMMSGLSCVNPDELYGNLRRVLE